MARPTGSHTAEAVGRLASSGDGLARRVWEEAVESLGVAIKNYSVLLDPEGVIVGGGVARAGSRLFNPLEQSLARHLPPFARRPLLLPAALGQEAGCRGAAAAIWRKLGYPVTARPSPVGSNEGKLATQ
jgi:glucokinase